MIFSAEHLRLNRIVEQEVEDKRRSQVVQFRKTLVNLATSDLSRFCAYSRYVLDPASHWSLIEDLENAEKVITETKSKRRRDQVEFFKSALIKTLVQAMTARNERESFNVKLLEILS
jgi:hypothetical protein